MVTVGNIVDILTCLMIASGPLRAAVKIQPSGYGISIIISMLVMIAVNKGITLVLLALSTRRERAPGVDLKGHQQGD